MVGGRRFVSYRDWMLLCIFALTFLYNKLFYSLIYAHFVTCAKIFCQSISLFMFCLLFCNCFSPLCIVTCMRQNTKTIQAIRELCNSFDLVDVWRTQHPNKKCYSWAKIKCRPDFWLISKQLLTRVAETDISAYYDSHHSPVTISLTPEDQSAPRGPGFWKFNNSLLGNEEFVTKLKFLIQNAKENYIRN